jgi:hypothetical protein
MSRVARLLITAVVSAAVLITATAAPSAAWHRHPGVFIGVGPLWWGPPYYPYWAYYPPPTYVYPPPPVTVQEPTVYVQQAPAAPPLPPPPDGPFWYYCPSARAYYPTVSACPEPWVKVPPRPE